MTALPHALRSDITRATFHALEGDAALAGPIGGRIAAGLAALPPEHAPALAAAIGEAIHRVALPTRRDGLGLLGRLYYLRRRRRIARLTARVGARRRALAEDHTDLAWVMACDPDPEIRAGAVAVLPAPPSPFHRALLAHLAGDPDPRVSTRARALADRQTGALPCNSD